MRTTLTEEEQRDYLLSKIKEPVHFTYPEPPRHRKGTLVDRFLLKDGEHGSVIYWHMIDRIEFEDKCWLRITYYRYKKKEKKWNFSGQTSFSTSISRFEELFVKAIKEKQWMKMLFRQILKQCSDLK